MQAMVDLDDLSSFTGQNNELPKRLFSSILAISKNDDQFQVNDRWVGIYEILSFERMTAVVNKIMNF